MKKRIFPLLTAMVLLGFISTSFIGAFSFTPISRTFTPSGRGATQSFRISNDGEENIAVQLKMLTREIDEQGKEHNQPADNLFTVYPSQIVLRPGASQTVKVQWQGPADIETEQCYRILVDQLPVDFGGSRAEGGNLRLLFRYLGSIYIRPEDTEADIRITSIVIDGEESDGPRDDGARDRDNRPRAVLVLENTGTRHAILNDLELTLSSSEGTSRSLSDDDLAGITGTNILPGGRRRFSVSISEGFLGGDIDAALSYDKTR